MPIGISEEHGELAGSLRKWAESLDPRGAIRAAEDDPARLAGWPAAYADMGLATIALPEPLGGGGSLLDAAVALEAAAGALVPGPLLTTTVAGLVVDDDGLRQGLADGTVSVGLALGGTVGEVVDGGCSVTHVLVPGGGGLGIVDAGRVAMHDGRSPDLGRPVGVLDGRVPQVECCADAATVRRLVGTLAAAEASGVARWCLDTAVEHAKVREQFGRKIGSFQAVKHLCAQMLETSESVTAAAWDAAVAATEGEQQWDLAVLVARTVCLDGAVEVAKSCIQVLGGIGFTFEHDAHLYLRRALALRGLYGGADRWAGELACAVAPGIRRTLHVDLGGRDAALRDAVRRDVAGVASAPAGERRDALVDSGLLTPHWPAPYGRGADPVEQLVIEEELAAAGIDRPDLAIGAWALPTILAHGSPEQRERFVGPTLRGEIDWCQLFSEPGAGSDLAGLRTRAVRVPASTPTGEGSAPGNGPGWRLTGQKVWTSLAREADWAICLARTDPEAKPHAGITYFLVDMRSAGIDVRPLRELTGDSMFNEVFLDDVFVPDDCVVGEVNGGWRLAVTTLANERVAMAGTRLGDSVERALDLYDAAGPAERERIGRAVAWATVVKLLGTRATLRSLAGQGPGPESSVAKLVGVRSRQDAAELVVELLGRRAFDGSDLANAAWHELLLSRCLSIAGGTTQILRNVAGERILGLPR